ncbi:MAG: TfoX/Sxy family protein [Cytophagales bacterium]|nr:TfoX/Sxy family protein [Cytophagales bacterium]
MAYNEKLASSIRRALASIRNVEEKNMMGGLTFMVNNKMCVGVLGDEMMCRIDPAVYEDALERNGCRPMDFTGRPMKGFVFVEEAGYQLRKDFDFWISLSLAFNTKAKASRKKKPAHPAKAKKKR